MSRFRKKFLAFLQPAPMKADRDENSPLAEGAGLSSCKGHLRVMCEGILLKGEFVDGWADASDGAVGHAAW